MTEPAKLSDQILQAHLLLRDHVRSIGCISYLQRKLDCGYNRAALVLAFLEDAKVISAPNNAGERRWLMDCDAAVRTLQEAI